jgi:hypothetical protein
MKYSISLNIIHDFFNNTGFSYLQSRAIASKFEKRDNGQKEPEGGGRPCPKRNKSAV